MNRIICSSVDFVFANGIETTSADGTPVLKDGKNWMAIRPVELPVYHCVSERPVAGPVKQESLSVTARHVNLTALLIEHCGFHVVLRLKTSSGETFFMGSTGYPAKIDYTTDGILDRFTFKAVSPA